MVTPAPTPIAYDLLFQDDFSDHGSGFPIGTFEHQSVAYTDAGLQLQLTAGGRSTLSMRDLITEWGAVRMTANVRPQPTKGQSGFFGLACGLDDADYDAALLGADGGYAIVRVSQGVASVLQRSDAPVEGVTRRGQLTLGLECVGTSAGQATVTLSVNSREVAAAADPLGLIGFRRVGFEAETSATSDGFTLLAQRAVVDVATGPELGIGPGQTFDPAVALLLDHVPSDLRASCVPQHASDPNVLAVVSCTPSSGATGARYILYDSATATEAAFSASVAANGQDSSGVDCSVGPSLGQYLVNGQPAGGVACYVLGGGAWIEWTDDQLAIRALGWRADASFPGIAAWWQTAGPIR